MRSTSTPISAPVVLIAGARAAYVGPSMQLAAHKNAVAMVAVGLDRPFEASTLLSDGWSDYARARIAVVPPGRLHHLRATGRMMFLYCDALGDDWRALQADPPGDAVGRWLAGVDRAFDGGAEPMLRRLFDAALGASAAAPERSAGSGSRRIEDAIRAIAARPQDFPTVAHGARLAGLSPGRFQHAFRAAVGAPFRSYRRWRRMAVAAEVIAEGGTLTQAALEAGFSGSAHFSSAFKEMFGLAPSRLLASGVTFQCAGGRTREVHDGA